MLLWPVDQVVMLFNDQVLMLLEFNKFNVMYSASYSLVQRWSRGHKARGQGQGHKKNPRPRTSFSRTDTLQAQDRNARGQGQGPRTQPQVFSTKKVFKKVFQAISNL